LVFWVVTPCSDLVGYRGFGGPCCLHVHGEVKWYRTMYFLNTITSLLIISVQKLFCESRSLVGTESLVFIQSGVSSLLCIPVAHPDLQNNFVDV
jgi:hypothetical protein